MSVARALSTLAAVFGLSLAVGCDDALCEAGEPCTCADTDTCFFECSGDGCDMSCQQMVNCGMVCEDDCSVECHDMGSCTTSCGDNCTLDCHNL